MLNPVPRPEPRKRTKGRARRLESAVVQKVRAICVDRDGNCRLNDTSLWHIFGPCIGESEWCHLPDKRRSKTRGMAPEARHTTQGSMMACTEHHNRIDRRGRPWIQVQPATSRGADGPLGFQCGATVYVEPEK